MKQNLRNVNFLLLLMINRSRIPEEWRNSWTPSPVSNDSSVKCIFQKPYCTKFTNREILLHNLILFDVSWTKTSRNHKFFSQTFHRIYSQELFSFTKHLIFQRNFQEFSKNFLFTFLIEKVFLHTKITYTWIRDLNSLTANWKTVLKNIWYFSFFFAVFLVSHTKNDFLIIFVVVKTFFLYFFLFLVMLLRIRHSNCSSPLPKAERFFMPPPQSPCDRVFKQLNVINFYFLASFFKSNKK